MSRRRWRDDSRSRPSKSRRSFAAARGAPPLPGVGSGGAPEAGYFLVAPRAFPAAC